MPGDAGDVAGHLKSRGLTAEVLGDPGPGIKKAVRTADPDGFAVELYSEPAIEHRPYSFTGIMPFKLGHIAIFTTDIEKSVAFYREALGLRFSDR